MAVPQQPAEEPERRIGIIEPEPLNIPFGPDNAAVIKEMIDAKYGETPKDLIINALTILYTIAKKAPKATEVTVQTETGTMVHIPITRIP